MFTFLRKKPARQPVTPPDVWTLLSAKLAERENELRRQMAVTRLREDSFRYVQRWIEEHHTTLLLQGLQASYNVDGTALLTLAASKKTVTIKFDHAYVVVDWNGYNEKHLWYSEYLTDGPSVLSQVVLAHAVNAL